MCVCVIFSLIDHKPCLFESRPLWHNNSPSDSPPGLKEWSASLGAHRLELSARGAIGRWRSERFVP